MIWNPDVMPRATAEPFHWRCRVVTFKQLEARVLKLMKQGDLEAALLLNSAIVKIFAAPHSALSPP